MNKHMAVLGCVLALGGSACSGSGGSSSSSSSSGGGGSATLREVFLDLFLAQCAFDERCAADLGRSFSTKAACEAYFPAILDAYMSFYEAAYEVADGSKKQACLDALYPASGSCTDTAAFPAVCRELIRVKNPAANGATCGNDENGPGCGFDSVCVADATGCNKCRALVDVGGACGEMQPCVSGAWCNGGTCARLPGRGQSCATTQACLGNFDCEGPSGMETCQERAGLNADCTSLSCLSDLSCQQAGMGATCQPASAVGTACGRTAATACKGSYCTFATGDAAMGTCQWAFKADVGEPCIGLGTYNFCTEGYADVTGPTEAPTGCTCRAYKAAGETCTDYNQCATSCEGQDFSMTPPGPGTCAAPKASGEMCFGDSQCSSGNCADNGMCAPAPTCN